MDRTMFSSLTFGTACGLEGVREALASAFGLEFRTGDSDYRGGVYYESPRELGGNPYAEHWYIQRNADMGEVAEEEWPDTPTLLYLEATTTPEDRLQAIENLAGLHLLRRDDWPDPRS